MAELQFNEVTKNFGSRRVLDKISFQISKGECLSLLGANGAGKSTLYSMAAGLRGPDQGKILLFGQDPRNATSRSQLGLTPQHLGFSDHLKVKEILYLVRSHYKDPEGLNELIQLFQLEMISNRQCGGLSGGEKRKLALACTFAGRPRLVLLDEPTTGLDFESRKNLLHLIKSYVTKHEVSLLLTTHHFEEAEFLTDRALILQKGRLLFDSEIQTAKQKVGLKKVRFSSTDNLRTQSQSEFIKTGDQFEVWTTDPDEYVRELVGLKQNFQDLEIQTPTLEEAFLKLTLEQTP